jgi:hypothetical protein
MAFKKIPALLAVLIVFLAIFPGRVSRAGGPVTEELELRLTVPRRIPAGYPLTLKAELIGPGGVIAWETWRQTGRLAAFSADDRATLDISTVIFDERRVYPGANEVAFYNGIGSASFRLEAPDDKIPDVIVVELSVAGVQARREVRVLKDYPQRTVKNAAGPDDIVWGPEHGVIRVVDDFRVRPGQTLWIKPGTLIMIDPGPPKQGKRIIVHGRVMSLGTREDPVYLFSSAGQAAMKLSVSCKKGPFNTSAWGAVIHASPNRQKSVYRHTIFTGGGNGELAGHTVSPMLWFKGKNSFDFIDSACVDVPGKCLMADGDGEYLIERALFSRAGHGAEFLGVADYSLRVIDSSFLDIGRGPADCDLDGDMINIRNQNKNSGGDKVVRRSVFTGGGDDGIDLLAADVLVEDVIISDIRDKAVSAEGGGTIKLSNALIFDTRLWGIYLDGVGLDAEHITVTSSRPLKGPTPESRIKNSIFWPHSFDTCWPFEISHSIVGAPHDLGCGEGNLAEDPRFRDAESYDFRIADNSPAAPGAPGRAAWGWQGYPGTPAAYPGPGEDGDGARPGLIPEAALYDGEKDEAPFLFCVTDAHCADDNPCARNRCEDNTCVSVPVEGPCDDHDSCTENTRCRDGVCVGEEIDCQSNAPECSIGYCESRGHCSYDPVDDGRPCDDGLSCTGQGLCRQGTCRGRSLCPFPQQCREDLDACALPQDLPVRPGDNWSYFVARRGEAPPDNWSDLDFDGSGWAKGRSGIGYGYDNLQTVVQNNWQDFTVIYTRKDFMAAEAKRIKKLVLTVDYDDGFVAFLNGKKVASRHVPEPAGPDTPAGPPGMNHEASGGDPGQNPNPPEAIDISEFIPLLEEGRNVLAVQVHNAAADSSDLALTVSLEDYPE